MFKGEGGRRKQVRARGLGEVDKRQVLLVRIEKRQKHFIYQTEDKLQIAQESRGLGDVYRGQKLNWPHSRPSVLGPCCPKAWLLPPCARKQVQRSHLHHLQLPQQVLFASFREGLRPGSIVASSLLIAISSTSRWWNSNRRRWSIWKTSSRNGK